MPQVHLIHGFNVSDGGRGSVGTLRQYIPGTEMLHDYGWTGLFFLRRRNRKAVAQILPYIRKGDFIVAHSNGALIAWKIAMLMGDNLGGVVVFNAALRRDTQWPAGVPVLCLHNSTDWVVQLGRIWGRLVSLGGLNPHGWGAAGRYGFNQVTVVNRDMSAAWWDFPVHGHSGQFQKKAAPYWGGQVAGWIAAQV